jgi:hypothetical protein
MTREIRDRVYVFSEDLEHAFTPLVFITTDKRGRHIIVVYD